MKRTAWWAVAITFGVSLATLGVAACGSDDFVPAIEIPDAALDGPSSSSTSSGGTTSSSTSSGGSTSTSSGGSSGQDSGTDASDAAADAADGGDAATATYSIGGTVNGLSGSGLVLQNNAGDDLTISADGSFVFKTKLATNQTYAVTIKTQPINPAQTCTVSGGSGTVATSDVTSITVNCAAGEYTVGGTASGLTGSAVLQNNGGDDLIVAGNGTFAFSQTLGNGETYAVTVLTPPPGQKCTITNGSGSVAAANVNNILLACSAETYSIGGSVTGLDGGKSVQLKNNGADTITVNANGAFSFPTELMTGAAYNVTVSTQPAGQTCTVSGGTGNVGTADVTSVVVNCAAGAYTVGGSVSGLVGSVVLQNNGADDLTLTANGSFAFATTLANNATYNVTVKTQPTGQTCIVANGSGMIAGANVTNVSVTCTTNKYTIGGTITGLKGSVVLQNNGGDNLTRNADGSFTFMTSIPYNGTYNVTVLTQPNGQVCTVSNGSGVVGTSNVTDIVVTCEDKHTIGGTIAGLAASPVVLQNNGGDNLTVNANGSFTFATPLAEGQTYNVTVLTQPANRTCTVTNGSGTVGTTDVTTIVVTCVP